MFRGGHERLEERIHLRQEFRFGMTLEQDAFAGRFMADETGARRKLKGGAVELRTIRPVDIHIQEALRFHAKHLGL